MRFGATCTWGDGPDVLLTIYEGNYDPYPLIFHKDGTKSIGLTRREALNLALNLIAAYDTCTDNELSLAKMSIRELENK